MNHFKYIFSITLVLAGFIFMHKRMCWLEDRVWEDHLSIYKLEDVIYDVKNSLEGE